MSYPILIISDDPTQHTGLARITRDLATMLASDPSWHVATLGYMGIGSGQLPWQQFHMPAYSSLELALQASLPNAWDSHSRGKPGIVMTIWDITRLGWLCQPERVRQTDYQLFEWLEDARAHKFKLWSYLPIDASGPMGRLTTSIRQSLLGVDRLLAYSPWAEDVVKLTISDEEAVKRGLTWMPHGVNGVTFCPADGESLGRIGVVATNQPRKDWGLVAQLAAMLPETKWWWHVDTMLRHWDIDALVADFGLTDRVEVTLPPMGDAEMARRYRQCALTVHPGLGEGFGLPIFESLACGIPALHINYGGGASIMSSCGLDDLLVPPSGQWRLEGQHNSVRPIHSVEQWLNKIKWLMAMRYTLPDVREATKHLQWAQLRTPWLKWFEEGIR